MISFLFCFQIRTWSPAASRHQRGPGGTGGIAAAGRDGRQSGNQPDRLHSAVALCSQRLVKPQIADDIAKTLPRIVIVHYISKYYKLAESAIVPSASMLQRSSQNILL